jgi:hypothetical protein
MWPMPTTRPTTLERAYQLARSGRCRNVGEIRTCLKAEGFGDYQAQLTGPMIQRALQRLCIAARPGSATPA